MKPNNVVIKNLSPEMGKGIIKYFKSLGVDTRRHEGVDYDKYPYYGVINDNFHNYTPYYVEVLKPTIIELPAEFMPTKPSLTALKEHISSLTTEERLEVFKEFLK